LRELNALIKPLPFPAERAWSKRVAERRVIERSRNLNAISSGVGRGRMRTETRVVLENRTHESRWRHRVTKAERRRPRLLGGAPRG
jgi:hypothetical protein